MVKKLSKKQEEELKNATEKARESALKGIEFERMRGVINKAKDKLETEFGKIDSEEESGEGQSLIPTSFEKPKR